MNEVVLRIVLQDGGGNVSHSSAGAPTGSPQSGGIPPAPHPQSAPTGNYTPLTGRFAPRLNPANFDPVEEAKRRRQREEMLQKIDEEYHKLYPKPQLQFDPVVEAQRRLDTERRRAEVEKEYNKLNPPDPKDYLEAEARAALVVERRKQAKQDREEELLELEARAALDVALKRQEAADKALKAEIALEDKKKRLLELEARAALAVARKQQEAAILDAIPVFDPVAEARKRREKERQRAQIDAAYEDQYGSGSTGTSGPLGQILQVAGRFRGIIGGLTGTIVGAALDAAASMERAQAEVKRKSRQAELLEEAEILDALAPDPEVLPAGLPEAVPATPGPRAIPTKPSMLSRGVDIPTAQHVPEAQAVDLPNALPPDAVPATTGGGQLGTMDSMMAAARPAAAALAIAKAVTDAAVSFLKGGIGAAGGLANWAASTNTDLSVPIEALGSAASSAGEKIALINPVIGLLGVAVGETGKAFAHLMQQLDKTAERYGEFSPLIAQQQAMVEVKQTLGDLRRAQEAGPELARYVQLQGELQQKFEDIKIKLLTRILAVVNPMLETLEAAVPTGEGIETAINSLTDPLGAIATAARKLVGMQEDKKIEDIPDPTSVLFRDDDKGVRVPGGLGRGE